MAVKYSLVYFRYPGMVPNDIGEKVGIGRAVDGVEPTLWPVDISALLSSSYTPTTAGVRPRGFSRDLNTLTFTIQAIDGSADLDKLQRIAQKSINNMVPGALWLYDDDTDDHWTITGYLIGFAPQEFEWKRGSVLMECTFQPTAPWYRDLDLDPVHGDTFTLPAANLPSGFVFFSENSTGSITITSDKGFSNTYYIGAQYSYLDVCGVLMRARAGEAMYANRPAACTPKGGGAYLFEGLPPDPEATYTITCSPQLLLQNNCAIYELRTAPTWE